jgi:deoxyribonuclease V
VRVLSLHPWAVEYHGAVAIQNRLRERLVLAPPPGLAERPDLLVAGADIAYSKSSNRLFAAVVVLRLTSEGLEVIETRTGSGTATFPYIPGLLSFREIPVLAEVFRQVRSEPDVVMLDGQGTAHPRGFGLACHVGVLLDRPTVGCAKSRLCGEHRPVPRRAGARAPLFLDGREVGAVLRSRTGIRPLFVSPGHKMDAATAVRIVLRCCTRYRIPEPTRRAHLLVTAMRTVTLQSRG